ncbi:hypothetical protein D1007_20172 [Hordeum vulgare]|nr:hypothetical protein D1007_20172 [Hordeum vulgare]
MHPGIRRLMEMPGGPTHTEGPRRGETPIRPTSSRQVEPVPPLPRPTPPSMPPPPSPPTIPGVRAEFGSVPVVSAATVRARAVVHGTPAVCRVTMAYVPGDALRRSASSSCKVVGTPAMEAEANRLHSSALVLTAVGHFVGISADAVARAVERDLRFPISDFIIAPFFSEDFLLTLFQPAQRDMALERQSIIVAGVQFKLRPWLPPAGTSRIWRYYYHVAIEKLPLTAWDWESVKEVLGKDCELDLIECQSTTKANCSALFAWLWTWHPDKIPRAADFTILQTPNVVRPREFFPEGTRAEDGREGPSFPVLIHLDVVKDFTPTSTGRDDRSAWPCTYRFKGKWHFGTKDGEGRARSASSYSNHLADRQSDDEEGYAGGHGSRHRRGSRGGVCKRFFRSMHEQAMCRDTASREPEPRRHRRYHAVGTAGVVVGGDEQEEQPAQEGRSLAVSNVIPAQGKRKLVQHEEWKTVMMQHAGMQTDKPDDGAMPDSLERCIHSCDDVFPKPAMQSKPSSLHIVPGSTEERGSMEGQGDKWGSHEAVFHGPVVTEATSTRRSEMLEMQAAGMDAIQPSHAMLQEARSILVQKEKGLWDPLLGIKQGQGLYLCGPNQKSSASCPRQG